MRSESLSLERCSTSASEHMSIVESDSGPRTRTTDGWCVCACIVLSPGAKGHRTAEGVPGLRYIRSGATGRRPGRCPSCGCSAPLPRHWVCCQCLRASASPTSREPNPAAFRSCVGPSKTSDQRPAGSGCLFRELEVYTIVLRSAPVGRFIFASAVPSSHQALLRPSQLSRIDQLSSAAAPIPALKN